MQIVHILSKQRTWSVLIVFGLMLMALWFSTQGYMLPSEIPNHKNFETLHNAPTLLAKSSTKNKYTDFVANTVQLDGSETDGEANNCGRSVPLEIRVTNNDFFFFDKKRTLPTLCVLKFKNPQTQIFDKVTHFTVELMKDIQTMPMRKPKETYTFPFEIDNKHFVNEGTYQIMCVVNYSPENKGFFHPEASRIRSLNDKIYINNFTIGTFPFKYCKNK